MERGLFRPFRSSDAERSDRTAGDRQRHRNKVRQAIKDNIGDIIADESIIGKDRNRIVKVPIRGIKEYRFVYGKNASGVGQGDGNSSPGQVVGREEQGKGNGKDKAGDQPGVDYYEADVPLDELIDIMFEDLELPDLERKKLKSIEVLKQSKRKGYRHAGIIVRLDKRRTHLERLKRKRQKGLGAQPPSIAPDEIEKIPEHLRQYYFPGDDGLLHQRFAFHEHDLQFKHNEPDIKEESNAVVVCIMDTSGSMDITKKYLARVFFFCLYQFVTTKYQTVDLVFVAHHTEAKEVTEEEFFHKGESGGTMISSGYAKALEIVRERYHPSLWNIYMFHCSDGDNWGDDDAKALTLAKEILELANLFGYAEIKPGSAWKSESSMLKVFKQLKESKNFHAVVIKEKEDVWKCFKALIQHDKAEA